MAANDEYYYAIGDEQRGPVPAAQLPVLGVTAGTLVWREGMGDWVRADKLPEVAAVLAAAAAQRAAAAHNPYGAVPGSAAATPPANAAPPPPGYPSAYAPPPAYGAPQGYAPSTDPAAAPPYGAAPGYAQPGYPPANQSPIGYAGAPAYGAGAYGPYAGGGYAPIGTPPGHGQCLASMILGICALPTAFCYGLGLILGIVAVVLGHLGQGTHKRATGRPNGMATAGLICGYVAIGLTVLMVAAVLVALAGAG